MDEGLKAKDKEAPFRFTLELEATPGDHRISVCPENEDYHSPNIGDQVILPDQHDPKNPIIVTDIDQHPNTDLFELYLSQLIDKPIEPDTILFVKPGR